MKQHGLSPVGQFYLVRAKAHTTKTAIATRGFGKTLRAIPYEWPHVAQSVDND